jgi:general stress protein YciG
METPREYYYTYYSYEEYGRGYIGSRGCKCFPQEDVRYFGSFKDKSFKPTQKIILRDDYVTREEAYADEIILQKYYNVVENSHFANRSYQTSTKFYIPTEQRIEIGRKSGKNGGIRAYELGVGAHGRSKEKMSEDGKRGGTKSKELGLGIHRRTKEQMAEYGKKGGKIGGKVAGKNHKENGTAIFGRTKEKMSEDGKKGAQKAKELGVGICNLTEEQLSKNGKKGGSISGKMNYENKTGCFSLTIEERLKVVEKTNSQRWKCCKTGYISTAAGVVVYQKARGIDASKSNRRRIE